MNKKPRILIAVIMLIFALVGLLIITIYSTNMIIRAIAVSAGVLSCVVVGILYYVYRKENRRGK